MFTNFERFTGILFYKRIFYIFTSGVSKMPSSEFDSEKKRLKKL